MQVYPLQDAANVVNGWVPIMHESAIHGNARDFKLKGGMEFVERI